MAAPRAGTSAPRSGRIAVIAALAVGLAVQPAVAQSARASFLLQMLRNNTEPRVRLNAALRLGELRDRDSVPPMMELFPSERDPLVQATILASLAAIGDPRAIDTVRGATRSPARAVSQQARRALAILERASPQGPSSPSAATSASDARPSLLIAAGRVNVQSGIEPSLQAAAQRALDQALAARPEVLRHTGPASQTPQVLRDRRLRGAHQFDANVQSVSPQGAGFRVAVSLVVSSLPGRAYEFDASTAVTVAGGGDPRGAALDRAMSAAVHRAMTQLLSGPR
jgi:hypothetical protein